MRERELKPVNPEIAEFAAASLPMRERELKQMLNK